jgi:hypothetical protein
MQHPHLIRLLISKGCVKPHHYRRREFISCNAGWAAFRDIVFRSLRFPFLGRRMEGYGLSNGQSADASDRAVDSRVVLVRTNDRL